MSIQKLPAHVVNQIAAGEVVERPSHMVKELIENSLDAEATEIEINFDEGGRLVEITDNGTGIDPQDLPLVFARHATSKIFSPDDLWKLNTFGFRGEALASIGSVSDIRLTSKYKDLPGHRLDVTFGEMHEPIPMSAKPGTHLAIRSLFENVPARLKFLKSESAEGGQIKTVVRAMALAHPGVTFRLKQKNKLIEIWQKRERQIDRVKDILGVDEVYTSLREVAGYQAEVFFASPHHIAKTSRQMWFFVNHRFVQDRTLQSACMDAYQGLLMHGEFPLCVLFFQAGEGLVDVNIHPTKSQVKFQDNSLVFRLVRKTLREGLEKAPWLKPPPQQNLSFTSNASDSTNESAQNFSSLLSSPGIATPGAAYYDATAGRAPGDDQSVQSSSSGELRSSSGTDPHLANALLGEYPQPLSSSVAGSPYVRTIDRPYFPQSPPSDQLYGQPVAQQDFASTRHQARGVWSSLDIIGQAHLTYIITQTPDKMVLVDQHAAHERVLYERLMHTWREGKADAQKYLLPLEISFERHLLEALWGAKDEIEKFGFEIEQAGPETLYVQQHPVGIREKAIVSALTKMAHEINERGGSLSLERVISDFCATMACHSAIRAGDRIEREQMAALLTQMDEFPLSSFCPHGRPVSVEISFRSLEKDFGRIV